MNKQRTVAIRFSPQPEISNTIAKMLSALMMPPFCARPFDCYNYCVDGQTVKKKNKVTNNQTVLESPTLPAK